MTDLSTYRKQTHREHILSLPDTYIGSIETAQEEVFLRENEGFVAHTIPVNPGFYKLIDELLVNAHDHAVRTKTVKSIEITCTPTTFSIKNDGDPIAVAEHPEHKTWIPQMIFGELLTSTNYNKDEKKLVGGKNGYGVKLVNIFAKQMVVTIVDQTRSLIYTQTFKNNMTEIGKPAVKASKHKSYVCIDWTPDFGRFGMKTIDPDMTRLIERRVWDLAMTLGKDVKVYWNDTQVKCKNLTEYAKAFGCDTVVADSPNERWQIAIADTPADKFFAMSFVNGVWTSKNGTHVDAVTNQVVNHIVEYLDTKKKVKVRPGLVKDHLGLFVISSIENPSFTSQTKETLTTKVSAFGSSPKLSEDVLKKVVSKLAIVPRLLEAQSAKDAKENSKTDGKKQSKITGIPKLDDALLAGTKDSAKCTLILTEGDSAKAMALSGLSQEQRKSYGVYPLKGKILNVKDTADSKVEQTKEIAELKKIIGLTSGKKYTNTSDLRYGSILIMTDQDYDGSHIRGLLINLFHELWHELMTIPGFLTYMATPIVKAHKGAQERIFYTNYEYEEWRKAEGAKGWKVKYYKGLGTSTREEAKEYFKKVNAVKFSYTPETDEHVELAFNKSRANDRKEWLKTYDRSSMLPLQPSYSDFVNKDLIHFSYYNLERSIPSVMDGLKTSQRKILFAAFKRNLTQEIRVAQLAGYVSEHTGYHHGEASLNETIISMAQTFMGSNNIPWFVPEGQFGTRLQGGKDAASPRYIHTYLQPNVKHLVPAEDFPVLTYRDDDGVPVEPEWYAPVLPMLLVNGSRGIGTGYSTYIPPCNPNVLKTALLGWLNGGTLDTPLSPWFAGFKGRIDGENATGVYRKEGDGFVVTELPPGTWTSDYREWLEKEGVDYTDTSTDMDVMIRVKMPEEALVKSLTTKIKTTNMHAFNAKGVIHKYETLNDILKEYADVRLALYETRRLHQIAALKEKVPYHENIVKFIVAQCDDKPPRLHKKSRAECDDLLAKHAYAKVSDSYDYILRLPVSSFTAEVTAKHMKDLKELADEIKRLEATTAKALWLHDLQSI
uniref:DNA topoisomerase (ATP-hydrolyzing) n=1 Tax=viral metagenome TaxID=1070528 RepID=A0A6C0M1U0_9ZZZZ